VFNFVRKPIKEAHGFGKSNVMVMVVVVIITYVVRNASL
jgi:hypothetical protein